MDQPSSEKKHRKITIRKRNDEDSNLKAKKPPLIDNKVKSDEFMSVDLANPS